jgi:gas vesicle protein
MSMTDILGAFVTGALVLAALSLIVAPDSQAAKVLNAFGENFSQVISSAKNYPK